MIHKRKSDTGFLRFYCVLGVVFGCLGTIAIVMAAINGEDVIEFEWSAIPAEHRLPVVIVKTMAMLPAGTFALAMGWFVTTKAIRHGCSPALMWVYRFWTVAVGVGWPLAMWYVWSLGPVQITSESTLMWGSESVWEAIVIGAIVLLPLFLLEFGARPPLPDTEV